MIVNGEDVEFVHSYCFYPSNFEKKINDIAGEEITTKSFNISFMPGLIQSFKIRKYKMYIFINEVLPNIGFKQEDGYNVVWDKDEVCCEI
jgi:hypothetical protein